MSMSVRDLLNDLSNSQNASTKTAAAVPAPSVNSVDVSRAALNSSIENLIASGQTKTASANNGSAIQHLEKVASELAQADEAAIVKEAQIYGAAVFDGFLARANSYAQHAEKTASHDGHYSNDELVKVASAYGYDATQSAIERLVQAENFAKTAAYQQQEQLKTASAHETLAQGALYGMDKLAEFSRDCFTRGYEHMGLVAEHLRRG